MDAFFCAVVAHETITTFECDVLLVSMYIHVIASIDAWVETALLNTICVKCSHNDDFLISGHI